MIIHASKRNINTYSLTYLAYYNVSHNNLGLGAIGCSIMPWSNCFISQNVSFINLVLACLS